MTISLNIRNTFLKLEVLLFQDSNQRCLLILQRASGSDAEQEEGQLGRVRSRGRALHQEHHRQVRRFRVRTL